MCSWESFFVYFCIMFTVVFLHLTWEWNVEFRTKANTIEDAETIKNAIADFSNFEIDNRLKPDYSSVSWIEDENWEEIEESDD